MDYVAHDLRQFRRLVLAILPLLASREFRDLPLAEQDRRIDGLFDLQRRLKKRRSAQGRLG